MTCHHEHEKESKDSKSLWKDVIKCILMHPCCLIPLVMALILLLQSLGLIRA